jgi:4-carboxymuconolactone decarboxylase
MAGKYLSKILFFILIISIQIMNGQSKPTDNELNTRQQHIITIASLTAAGDVSKLKEQLNSGLDSGLSINEIKEILVQLYAYCGFPRSLNAISCFMNVLEERKSKGIDDPEGKKIVLNNDPDKYEQGRKVLEILTKTPQSKPAPGFGEFAPRIDAFLKEHLFADIFDSDVLTYQQRELVTIAALSAMPGLESQLQSHIKMGINTGITENQLLQAAALIEKYINKTQADSFRKLFLKPADTASVNKGN